MPALSVVLYHLASDHTSDVLLVGTERACHVLHKLTQHDLVQAMDALTAYERQVLELDAAVLFDMLQSIAAHLKVDTSESAALLHNATVELVFHLVVLYDSVVLQSSPQHSASRAVSTDGLEHASVACYESWPQLYTRPRYAAFEDEHGRSREKGMYRKCDNSKPTALPNSQQKFTPGIFKVSCVHGITYGFHFLKHPESPNEFFTLLLTRFPRDQLPHLLFYDNGCKLHEYILNREPWMLKAMKIFVDNFHYGSSRGPGGVPIHKCPSSFCASNSAASLFNTQYEEHTNAVHAPCC